MITPRSIVCLLLAMCTLSARPSWAQCLPGYNQCLTDCGADADGACDAVCGAAQDACEGICHSTVCCFGNCGFCGSCDECNTCNNGCSLDCSDCVDCVGVCQAIYCTATPTCVYNDTDVSMHAWIPGAPFDIIILAGNSSCYLDIFDPNDVHQLWVASIVGDGDLDFEAVVDVPAGGEAYIETRSRYWELPDNHFVRTYGPGSSSVYDHSDPTDDATVRNVRFLAAADCQYWDDPSAVPDEISDANDTNAQLGDLLHAEPELRGVLYAGDLTHYSRFYSEFAWYEDSIDDDAERFLFDGVGNHDQIMPQCDQLAACALVPPLNEGCVDPWAIRSAVRDRKRNTVKTDKSDDAHYSWDWHDVHFVQLNLYPGTDLDPPTEYLCGVYPEDHQHLSPYDSLDFLIDDLATYVGASGRPVVLIHHFGFDSFSLGWWTAAERLAYWNAIAPYNVVAIFTGHNHFSPADPNWRADFSKPGGATGGPAFIPGFVAAGALKGAYLGAEINGAGQILVRRWNATGAGSCGQYSLCQEECVWFPNTIYVSSGSPAPGYGWSVDPYSTITEAVSSCSERFAECNDADPAGDGSNVTIRVQAGLYPETMVLDKAMQILADGGLVTIGG